MRTDGTDNDTHLPMGRPRRARFDSRRRLGSGWSAANILRPNTVGAEPSLWIVRTAQPSDPVDIPQDYVMLQAIGDD